MNGQELYELYRSNTLLIEACEIEEDWESLSPSQQAVWNAVAEQASE